MQYKGIEVEFVSLLVYLEDKDTDDWYENEYIILEWLKKNNVQAEIENPVDDLVYITLQNDSEKELERIYNLLNKDFKARVALYLDDFIEGEGNEVEVTIEEYKNLLREENKFSNRNSNDKLEFWLENL